MSDPTQPPVNPASHDRAYPAAPSYQAPVGPDAPGYGQAPVYGQSGAYGQPPAYGQNPYGQQNPQDKYNVLSIISLVTSILLISVVGIITGHIALSQIKKTGEKGRGLALWGTILGYVGVLVSTIFVIITIALVIAAASTGAGYYR